MVSDYKIHLKPSMSFHVYIHQEIVKHGVCPVSRVAFVRKVVLHICVCFCVPLIKIMCMVYSYILVGCLMHNCIYILVNLHISAQQLSP